MSTITDIINDVKRIDTIESEYQAADASITALPDGVQVPWTAKDDSIQMLTKEDLRAILLDAGTQQTALWNDGRPSIS